ncbi:hypothetical protein [Tatumella ptyseos]|uniref:hypothetical protein n=1 Tax=Tatumella ptyseos TaxID=82987 RepID=UPI0023F45B3B|nr:hypothetical protein [Tatumella ptyseos]
MALLTWPLPQWVSDVGTITGLAGSIMTLFVYRETKALKKMFKRKVGLPQLQKNLNESASRITELLTDWDINKETIKQQFLLCAVWAESFAEKSPTSRDKLKINDFLTEVKTKKLFGKKKITITLDNNRQAWDLYSHLCTLNSRIDVIINDMKLD